MEWLLTREAVLDCETNSPYQHLRKCEKNGIENMRTDVGCKDFKINCPAKGMWCKWQKKIWINSDFLYLRVWGVNCGNPVQWNGSWRLMYIKRPHLLFVGMDHVMKHLVFVYYVSCYVSYSLFHQFIDEVNLILTDRWNFQLTL